MDLHIPADGIVRPILHHEIEIINQNKNQCVPSPYNFSPPTYISSKEEQI